MMTTVAITTRLDDRLGDRDKQIIPVVDGLFPSGSSMSDRKRDEARQDTSELLEIPADDLISESITNINDSDNDDDGEIGEIGEDDSETDDQNDFDDLIGTRSPSAPATAAPKTDDHALIVAIRAGDETAFQEIVRRYRNQITSYVYRMIDDYERAVDIAQETFVRVYMNVDRYQATYSFSTYIYRIAHNLAITELRQRKRRRLIPLPTFFSDKDSEEVEVEIPDERQVQADEAIIADERRRAVVKAIASLPEKYRAPLVLCDMEEKSYEEISEVLGLPTGTVKSRINRARNLLKDKLRDLL